MGGPIARAVAPDRAGRPSRRLRCLTRAAEAGAKGNSGLGALAATLVDAHGDGGENARWRGDEMNLELLIGSGDRIGLLTLPFLIVGVLLSLASPSLFAVGGPAPWLVAVSITLLVLGVVIWAWSAILIVTNVPRGRLITAGPYAWVKHPLYTAVALLVLPSAGILLDTWLGVVLGLVLYLASRMFSPAEEAALSRTFGQRWRDYDHPVKLRWL
jgi:protein-S-isoprenylcysteine O-methyltransferase Ste14